MPTKEAHRVGGTLTYQIPLRWFELQKVSVLSQQHAAKQPFGKRSPLKLENDNEITFSKFHQQALPCTTPNINLQKRNMFHGVLTLMHSVANELIT